MLLRITWVDRPRITGTNALFTGDTGSIGPDRGGAAARGGGPGRGMEDTNLSAPLAEVRSVFLAGPCR
jgi:hypothetical protein